jgi:hypothetical protein
MFHNRQLSIPRIEDDFKIGTGVGATGQSLHPSGAMDESDYNSDMPRNSLVGTFFFIHFSFLFHESIMRISCPFQTFGFYAYIDFLFTCAWFMLASLCTHIGQPLFYCLMIADHTL